MKVCGFVGTSGSGKTTLMQGVIRTLRLRGEWVSVIKHTHKDHFEPDVVGKDSWQHRRSGAYEVMAVNRQRFGLYREFLAPQDEPDLTGLMAQFQEFPGGHHWLLLEGMRHVPVPKVEVWRRGQERRVQYPVDPWVFAVATDVARADLPEPTALPVLTLDDPVAVAGLLLADPGRFDWQPSP